MANKAPGGSWADLWVGLTRVAPYVAWWETLVIESEVDPEALFLRLLAVDPACQCCASVGRAVSLADGLRSLDTGPTLRKPVRGS